MLPDRCLVLDVHERRCLDSDQSQVRTVDACAVNDFCCAVPWNLTMTLLSDSQLESTLIARDCDSRPMSPPARVPR